MNKRYIVLNENDKVVSIRMGPSIVEGEIESATGEMGQLLQPDGSFIDDPIDIQKQNVANRLIEIEDRMSIIRDKKELFDFGGLTTEEYEPFRLEAIDLLNEKNTLMGG